MIVKYEFNNGYDEDGHRHEDVGRLRLFQQAESMALLLDEIENTIFRPNRKHGYNDPTLDDESVNEAIERLEDMYYQLKNEYNVDLGV